MATPLLARFLTKKIAGCTNASHDFPPRKYNILLPTRGWHLIPFPSPQGMYGRAYADVTPKISRMDSLLNHLSYGAPLASPYARARISGTIPSLFEGLDHVTSLFYEYSKTSKKELEVQTYHTQWHLYVSFALYQLCLAAAWCWKYMHRYRFQ